MEKSLVIVESPAKAKTLERYLGKSYRVLASYGHVRDLLPKTGAVEPENGFRMHYEIIERNKRHVREIEKALKTADALYLATDPDREGEAIAWHLCQLLEARKALADKQVHRVVFHEITRQAILEAFERPRTLADNLVNAQQARRALDYLVGFNLSPLLWRKIHSGLSAGRVQSPALRMIVEREEEIERFEPREYWTVEADATRDGKGFPCKLTHFEGEKLEQFSIGDTGRAEWVRKALEKEAAAQKRAGETGIGTVVVEKIEKKERQRQPAAPFITSTLQQEAFRKLGFNARRTMRTAQQLYEGVDIGDGVTGLITYMRTDSVNLAENALTEIRGFIRQRYGEALLPTSARKYKTRAKNAQEAHEAIRPTSIQREPGDLTRFLSPEQLRLYELVWKRTVACQMKSARIHTVAANLACGKGNLLRATGSTIAFAGFLAVYEEGSDDKASEPRERDKRLPPLAEGDRVPLARIRAEQHFTVPPPRYSDASLVKALEEHGIGRPSTYATIIGTLQQREYVEVRDKRFVPTEVGRTVNFFLTEHFKRYVEYNFTARLEDELDSISRGEKEWIPVLNEFWQPFKLRLEEKRNSVTRREVAQTRELGQHPETGQPVFARMGRYGPYVQLGEGSGAKDKNEQKPRFVGLLRDQRLDALTLDAAVALLSLPRELGETEKGETIIACQGRYGPYLRYGKDGGQSGGTVSLPSEDNPCTITLERARELIDASKKQGGREAIKEFQDNGTRIRVLNGRFGPYVTDGSLNASVPKDQAPGELSLEQAVALLAQKAKRGRGYRPAHASSAKRPASSKKKAGRSSGKSASPGKKTARGKSKAPATPAKKRPALKKKAARSGGTSVRNDVAGRRMAKRASED